MIFNRSTRLVALLPALVLATSFAPVRAQSALPEQLVTSSEIIDYEFDWGRDGVYCPTCNFGQGNARLTFTDRTNNLWVAQVDWATGMFVPTDGKATLLDTLAAFAPDFGNGPEWMFSAAYGSQVVYTKYLPGFTKSVVADAGVGVATQTSTGWSAGMIANGAGKVSPVGSMDLTDTNPRINYQEADNSVWWRYLNTPASEAKVPNTDNDGATRSWVPNAPTMVYTAQTAPKAGSQQQAFQQVFNYNVATSTLTQLTTDLNLKFGAYEWYAPEYNGEQLMWSLVNRNEIIVYRNLVQRNGTKKWTPIMTVPGPAAEPYIWSPDLFVYNGKSYIFMIVSPNGNPEDFAVNTHVTIMQVDPTNPTMRYLTDPTTSAASVRSDPEYFISATGPYIYYNRYSVSTKTKPSTNQGVWRANPNLGAPITAP